MHVCQQPTIVTDLMSCVWLQLTGTVPALLSTITSMTELELETNKVGKW